MENKKKENQIMERKEAEKYRKEIQEMVEKISDVWILKQIQRAINNIIK